jgi:predicted deacetylase
MSSIYSSFNKELPDNIIRDINRTFKKALDIRGNIKLFFRADDIAVQSENFHKMMSLFIAYKTPICLAVVPTWITKPRWKAMQQFVEKGEDLFCWHMHGYRHVNHETRGKKQEFGPARSERQLLNDISNGASRLKTITGKHFTPVFTPPWNRCSLETMNVLKNIGFKGISRSYGNLPVPPDGFMDFSVHVDLHTRKEKRAQEGWQKLIHELKVGLNSPACGIMIHHMRMNQQAFIFLDYLLEVVNGYKAVNIVTYDDLI